MAFVIEQAIALVLPFIIGLLIGYILKQAFKNSRCFSSPCSNTPFCRIYKAWNYFLYSE